MKKVLSIVALVLISFASMAQDRIVRKDGEVVLAQIRAVTNQDVQYHNVVADSNGNYLPDGNTVHVMLLDKVERITLASGRVLYSGGKQITESKPVAPANPHIYPRYKNPALAYLLSTIPGVGQFYNDQIEKGFGFIAATIVEGLVFTICYNNLTKTETYTYYDDYYPYSSHMAEREVTNESAVTGAVLTGIAFFATYLWSSIDAVTTANKLNIANGYVLKAQPMLSYTPLLPMGKSDLTAGLSVSLTF